MRGLYKEFFRLQQKYLQNKKIKNVFQTNGTLVNESFIQNYMKVSDQGIDLGIGISLDGTEEVHDKFRVYRNTQNSTFRDIMRNIKLLSRYNIGFGVLSVVSDGMREDISAIYQFFKSVKNLHFLELIIPQYNAVDSVLKKENLRIIYTELFDRWFYDRNPNFSIRFFYSIVAAFLKVKSGLCEFKNNCILNNQGISINVDGEVSFCDCFPHIRIGDIFIDSFDILIEGRNKARKRLSLIEEKRIEGCLFCEWYEICSGGCPVNYVQEEDRPNYYCLEYKKIFRHIQESLLKTGISLNNGLTDNNLGKIRNPELKKYLFNLKMS